MSCTRFRPFNTCFVTTKTSSDCELPPLYRRWHQLNHHKKKHNLSKPKSFLLYHWNLRWTWKNVERILERKRISLTGHRKTIPQKELHGHQKASPHIVFIKGRSLSREFGVKCVEATCQFKDKFFGIIFCKLIYFCTYVNAILLYIISFAIEVQVFLCIYSALYFPYHKF